MHHHIHVHLHDAETKHDPSTGRFTGPGSKVTLSTGHVARKSDFTPAHEGEKTYHVTKPKNTETHRITHGGSGEVVSHSRRYIAKSNTPNVKGQRLMTEYSEKIDPETSEKKYGRLHKALRAAEVNARNLG